MSSTTKMLASLPNDIFTTITSDFDLADLCTLRLTSHTLNGIATTPGFQARFHYLRVDLSEDSLRSLVAICSSTDLGHLIKGITVLATHYDDRELQQQLNEGTRWVVEAAPAPFFASTGHRMTDEEKGEAKAMVNEIAALRNKQAVMRDDGTDVKLLAEALAHLGTRSILLSIEAAVHVRPHGPRLPIKSCRDTETMTQIMDHTVKATFAAFGKSQLQVSTFSLFNKQWGGFVTLKGLHGALATVDSSGTSVEHLMVPSALHSIKSLTLNLHPAPTKKTGEDFDAGYGEKYPIYGPADDPELHAVYLLSLAALLQPTAGFLEHLGIRFRGFHTNKLDCAQAFSDLASLNLTYSKLSTLDLHNVVIDKIDLVALLRSTPALTHLGLHKVSLPHNPSHPEKMVEYPDSHPQWSQMEPDIPGWKDGWKPVFEAFLAPKLSKDGTEQADTETAPLCPLLEKLEINALYLTSFQHRIYFTSPEAALLRYVQTITGDKGLWNQNRFKLQAFQEGLACCVLSGDDIRGNATSPVSTEEVVDVNSRPNASDGPQPRGITYRVATTRPYGSPAYYEWVHVWEECEFGLTGCEPAKKAVTTSE